MCTQHFLIWNPDFSVNHVHWTVITYTNRIWVATAWMHIVSKTGLLCFSLSHFCDLFWNVTIGWLLMTLADSGGLWPESVESARVSQSQPESARVSQSQPESANVSRSQLTLADYSWHWLTLAAYGWPWLTLTDSGRQPESARGSKSHQKSSRVGHSQSVSDRLWISKSFR